MRRWVSNFGGVSDEEREMERWRPAVARRLWVEASGSGEALHHKFGFGSLLGHERYWYGFF